MKQFIKSFTYGIAALLMVTSCSDSFFSGDTEEIEGEVRFSSAIADNAIKTRGIEIPKESKYEPLPTGYKLKIQMSHPAGDPLSDTKDGDAMIYQVQTYGTPIAVGTDGTPTADGKPSTLKASSTALYWPGNGIAYGFTATAGETAIPANQSDKSKLIAADRLLGYAGTNASHDALAYRTAKQWKADNENTTIPLFLKHQCAMISIILEPGEGVKEEAVKNVNVGSTLSDAIYSYGRPEIKDGDVITQEKIEDVEVNLPYHEETKINTVINGTTKEISTTKFTAIVEPYNYATNASQLITRIVINGQKYSFYASNDNNFGSTDEEKAEAFNNAYNLKAGDHLEITIKVGRDGRIIEVFAQQKDWEVILDKDFITDDFGMGADPVIIHCGENFDTKPNNQNSLEDFLNNTLGEGHTASTEEQQNAKGVIAILNNSIEMTENTATNLKALNATINLNGHTITTSHVLFSEIASTGVLKNGTIVVKGETGLPYAVSADNNGIIEKINIDNTDDKGNVIGQPLTVAGLVKTNNSEIRNCVNNVKVSGSGDYIGGIAATQTANAIISECVVNSKVCTSATDNTNTTLGGIIGKAGDNSIVVGCTYDYGITLKQLGGKVKKNIIGEEGTEVTHERNAWPTIDDNGEFGGNNFLNPYDAVIDYSNELNEICDDADVETHKAKRYRIADDFELPETWDPFKSSNGSKDFNMKASLEGNHKTITTNNKMVFQSILYKVSNLTICLNKSIVGTLNHTSFGCAALAKSIDGEEAYVENVKVIAKDPSYTITSPNPAGIVVSVTNGATVDNCSSTVSLIIDSPAENNTTTAYAGGIVSQAFAANIINCKVSETVTFTKTINTKATIFAGGIVGGLNYDENPHAPSIITDNACFMPVSYLETKDDFVKGAIIGYCGEDCFKAQTDKLGNWWKNDAKPVGKFFVTTDVFAPKNSIEPTFE